MTSYYVGKTFHRRHQRQHVSSSEDFYRLIRGISGNPTSLTEHSIANLGKVSEGGVILASTADHLSCTRSCEELGSESISPGLYRGFFRDMEIGELSGEELCFRAARRVV